MINFNKKIIFIHITKTGGTSLSRMLDNSVYNQACGKHWMAQDYSNKYPEYKTFDLFTVVRNPFDRAVSYYHYMSKHLSFDHYIKTCTFPPQVEWLKVNGVIDNNIKIYRFEIFNQMLNVLRQKYGFYDLTAKQSHINKSRREHYRIYYTDKLKNILIDKYNEDFKQFSYSFDS